MTVAALLGLPVGAATFTAEYSITFVSTWSAETHPQDFPANAHYSGPIGGTHNDTVFFWSEGEPASLGIQRMAEWGVNSPLDEEIQAAIDVGAADQILRGGSINPSPGQVSIESFTVSQDYPLVTLVLMVAPSPDWFTGVTGLPLFVEGRWVKDLSVEVFPYDAGTDSGLTYTSANRPTNPHEPVARILQEFPFYVDGTVPALGRFIFERLDAPSSVEHWELY